MTDKHLVLETISESLRSVSSIRDFVAAVEVGSKVASGMLDDVESALLRVMQQVGDE